MDTASNSAGLPAQVPKLLLTQEHLHALGRKREVALELAREIVSGLRDEPHAMLISGLPDPEEAKHTRRIARAIARLPGPGEQEYRDPPEKLSFTRVRIADSNALNHEKVTRYSRTNQPLSLHTDSSNIEAPHDLVAFQMVRSDTAGGETLLAPVQSICAALPSHIREILKQPLFPFSREPLKILWEANGKTHIRYYRSQIETALNRGRFISSEARQALNVLDEVLQSSSVQLRLRLEPGQTLFLANTQVLHGRTGFAPDSDRLMYRIRSYAPCLL